MIIVRLCGGLGNQMFQYAAGLAAAEATRSVLKLETDWFHRLHENADHNRYGLHCFNIVEQFATRNEIDRLRRPPFSRGERLVLRLARLARMDNFCAVFPLEKSEHHQPGFGYYEAFRAIKPHTRLVGMFQSELFFKNISPLVRDHFSFRYPLSAAASAIAERIRETPSATAVHFRLGDYKHDPKYARSIGALPHAYHAAAMDEMRRVDPASSFFVFSDDIESVKRDFPAPDNTTFVDTLRGRPAHETMRLMSMCKNNIIANSTFSWWAAWLNPAPDKTVLAPRPWFLDHADDTSDLVPTSWIQIPVPGWPQSPAARG